MAVCWSNNCLFIKPRVSLYVGMIVTWGLLLIHTLIELNCLFIYRCGDLIDWLIDWSIDRLIDWSIVYGCCYCVDLVLKTTSGMSCDNLVLLLDVREGIVWGGGVVMVLIAIEKIDWCRFGNPAAAYRQWSGDWSPLSSDPRSVVVELLVSAQLMCWWCWSACFWRLPSLYGCFCPRLSRRVDGDVADGDGAVLLVVELVVGS